MLGTIPKRRGRPPKNSAAPPPSTLPAEQKKITSLFPKKADLPASDSSPPTTTTSQTLPPSTPPSPLSLPSSSSTQKRRGRPPKDPNAPPKPPAPKKPRVIADEPDEPEEEDEDDDSEDEFDPTIEKDKKGKEDGEESGEEGNDREPPPPKKLPTPRKKSTPEKAASAVATPEKASAIATTPDKASAAVAPNKESGDASAATPDKEGETPKKKGRKSKAELEAMAAAGITPSPKGKKKPYIKKGEPGYVRPSYNYVKKGRTPRTPSGPRPVEYKPVVEEESPLNTSEFVILPDWMPSANNLTAVRNGSEYFPKSMGASFTWENSGTTQKLGIFEVCLRDIADQPDSTAILGASGEPLDKSGNLPKEGFCRDMVINAGGPIWHIEWCPIPLDQEDEESYLAVASYTTECTHVIGQIYHDKNIIQIWRVGDISDDGLDLAGPLPKLAFGIAHNGECVVGLKWCPLGGYAKADTKAKVRTYDRLGLLAASFADGSIQIFSVPHPKSIENIKSDGPLVLNLRPVFSHVITAKHVTLDSGEVVESGSCARCIDWVVDNDWSLLLAGSDDGSVSVWNLLKTPSTSTPPSSSSTSTSSSSTPSSSLLDSSSSSSPLSSFSSSPNPAPIVKLNAHRRRVTSLCWSPASKFQFVTCGQDGFVRFWDLRDPFQPLYQHLIAGGWIQCIEFPTPKLPYIVFGIDDDTLRLLDLRELTTSVVKSHFGPIWSTSTNLFNSTLASCSADGSVKYAFINERSTKKRMGIVEEILEQHVYNPETNTFTFSNKSATPHFIVLDDAENGNTETPEKTPKPRKKKRGEEGEEEGEKGEPKKKKAKGKEGEGEGEGEGKGEGEGSDGEKKKKKKKKKPKKKEEEVEEEDKKPIRALYSFPPEKQQINIVKWHPRVQGSRWIAFAGNGGLVRLKLMQLKK